MPDREVHSIICPCCGETIPVRIDLFNKYIDDGYVIIDGASISNEPFPIIEIGISLNIEALAEKMDILLPEYYEFQKRLHGVYDEDTKDDRL